MWRGLESEEVLYAPEYQVQIFNESDNRDRRGQKVDRNTESVLNSFYDGSSGGERYPDPASAIQDLEDGALKFQIRSFATDPEMEKRMDQVSIDIQGNVGNAAEIENRLSRSQRAVQRETDYDFSGWELKLPNSLDMGLETTAMETPDEALDCLEQGGIYMVGYLNTGASGYADDVPSTIGLLPRYRDEEFSFGFVARGGEIGDWKAYRDQTPESVEPSDDAQKIYDDILGAFQSEGLLDT